NMRDGTFTDVAAAVGLAAAFTPGDAITGTATADVNQDDYPDFFFGRRDGVGVLALSDGRGRFTVAPAPETSRASIATQFVDYDHDGLRDLVTWSTAGPRIARNLGRSWADATERAFAGASSIASSSRALAIADLDGDGQDEVLARSGDGSLSLWHASGVSNRSLRVQLKGRVSNRSALGAKIQMRAGSLSERLELSAPTPAGAPPAPR